MISWHWLQTELAYTRSRGESALRLTIAACLVLILGQMLKLPDYYWGIVTVFALALPTVGAMFIKSAMRLVGTVIAALLAFITVGILIQHHVMMFTFMGLVFFGMFYLGAGKTVPYTFLLAGITFNIITASSITSPYEIESIAPYRCFEIAVGIGVMGFCAYVFWPHFAKYAFQKQLADSLQKIADLHTLAAQNIREQKEGLEKFTQQADGIPAGLRKLPTLLDQTCAEDLSMQLRRPALETQYYRLERLLSLTSPARALLKFPTSSQIVADLEVETQRLLAALDVELRDLAESFRTLQPGTLTPDLQPARKALFDALHRLRHSGKLRDYAPEDNLRSETYLSSLLDTADLLGRMRTTLKESLDLRQAQRRDITNGFSHVLEALWRSIKQGNRSQIEVALKGTTTMLFVYIFGQTGYLGDMTSTAVSAGVIISAGQVGSVALKAGLRLTGCILGGIFSLILVILIYPHITSLGALVLTTAPFFLICAYLTTGSQEMNYVGFQAGLVIGLTALSSFTQPLDVNELVYRFYGILAGMFVAWSVMLCFPIHTAHQAVLENTAAFFASLQERLAKLNPQGTTTKAFPRYRHPDHLEQTQHLAAITSNNLTARLEMEPDALRADQAAELVHRLERVEAVLLELEVSAATPQHQPKLDVIYPAWNQLRDALAQQAQALAGYLRTSRRQRSELPTLTPALEAFDEAFSHVREHENALGGDTEQSLQTLKLCQHTHVLALRLREATELVQANFEPETAPPILSSLVPSLASGPASDR